MVELVRSARTPGELAREFEPSAEAIRNWVAQADRDAGKRSDGLRTEEQEEIRRLRRENRRLREEREILANVVVGRTRSCRDRNSAIGYRAGLHRGERPLAYWRHDPVANVVQGRLRTCKW
jgi:transposase